LFFPAATRTFNRTLLTIIGLAWGITGVGLVVFVAMNSFTHGGLPYNICELGPILRLKPAGNGAQIVHDM